MERNGNYVELYWNDLTPETQAQLLEVFGENCNWDVFPFAELVVDPDEEE